MLNTLDHIAIIMQLQLFILTLHFVKLIISFSSTCETPAVPSGTPV